VTEARIAVSERTVSRYFRDRLTAPLQTWRTFLANHLGDLAFTSMVTSSHGVFVASTHDRCFLRSGRAS